MIRIETTWKNLRGSWIIIKNNLDPTVVLKNCTLHIFSKDGIDVSYCTIQKYKAYIQLSTLVTKKEFRGNGYGRALLKHVVDNIDETTYLIARDELLHLYTKHGFEKTSKIPYSIKWRYVWSDMYNKLFRGQKSHVLRRT